MSSARVMGIAKPVEGPEPVDSESPNIDSPPALSPSVDDPAVSMPMTCPLESTSGPPESPAMTSASVSSRPVRRSPELPESSVAVMLWPVAVMLPVATEGSPGLAIALPIAATAMPFDTDEVSPAFIVVSPEAPCSLMRATSWEASVPSTFAE